MSETTDIIECGVQGCDFWGGDLGAIEDHLLAMKAPPAPDANASTLHNHKAHGTHAKWAEKIATQGH
jgi:hypothetical protein